MDKDYGVALMILGADKHSERDPHEPTRPTYPCIVVPHAWFASGERHQSRTFVPVHPTLFRIILLEALI